MADSTEKDSKQPASSQEDAGAVADDTRSAAEKPAADAASAQHADRPAASKPQPIRAINEDDDGYDPYSDLHDRPAPEPLFERDPWD